MIPDSTRNPRYFQSEFLVVAACLMLTTSLCSLILPGSAIAASSSLPVVTGNSPISLVDKLPVTSDEASFVILDVRKQKICGNGSLSSATCLPPEEFFADRGRMVNFSGLYWLLGTAGLTGSENVYIVGDKAQRKLLVAALLFVAGQSHIAVVQGRVDAFDDNQLNGHKLGKPQLRGTTRSAVFSAKPRTDRIVLKLELSDALSGADAPTLVDGRTESEYWARRIRAARGGHLPGAIWLSSFNDIAKFTSESLVLYGHDAAESLVLLARAELSGISSNIYLAGWVEWAADMQLPVDAEAFPSTTSRKSDNNKPAAKE